MPTLRGLITAWVLAVTVLASTGSPARADEGAVEVWAPYLIVGSSTVEIWNVADHATWPSVTVYLGTADGGSNCPCIQRIQGPRVEPGESWVFDLGERSCASGLPETICLPDGAIGGASIEAAIETGTGANVGATSRDPDGLLVASVAGPTGTYGAVGATRMVTLTGVGRRVADNDGLSTAIRLIGAGGLVVDW